MNVNQFSMISTGFQWEIYKNVYLKGKVNDLSTAYPIRLLPIGLETPDLDIKGINHSDMFGFGGELAYGSLFGPIRFVLHQNQYRNDLNIFVAFGYNIYKSRGHF